jgi:hypothetical protein
MNRYKYALISLAVMLLLVSSAWAQYSIPSNCISGGGGKTSNGDYQLIHTVGQPMIGRPCNDDIITEIGFRYLPWWFVTGVEDVPDPMPKIHRLYQNYPNPFNPVTTIQFELPEHSYVKLAIYDALGRKVVTVVDEEMEPGLHKVPVIARGLSSGVYFYRIETGGFVDTKKMILLR